MLILLLLRKPYFNRLCHCCREEEDYIGRLIVAEFKDNETRLFDEIMKVFRKYPDFSKYEVDYTTAISFLDLEIYPDQRKVYCGKQEISLTTKEFNLLHYFVANEGRVLTYETNISKCMGELCAGYRKQHDWLPCMQIKRKTIQSLPRSAI